MFRTNNKLTLILIGTRKTRYKLKKKTARTLILLHKIYRMLRTRLILFINATKQVGFGHYIIFLGVVSAETVWFSFCIPKIDMF